MCEKCVDSECQKRSSPNGLFAKRGSLTVESSIVIPLFLLAMVELISIMACIRFDMKVRELLYEEARTVSEAKADGNGYGIEGIKARINAELKNSYKGEMFKRAIEEMDFSESDFSDSEIMKIVVNYSIDLPFDVTGLLSIDIKDRFVFHTWIGYEHGLYGNIQGEDIVYVTENSEVYHVNSECSHLRLKIKMISAEDLETIRNDDGAKYKNCDICKSRPEVSKLYVTSDGTRYHATLTCPGIKRTYRAVPLYSVRDRRPCKRCGQ